MEPKDVAGADPTLPEALVPSVPERLAAQILADPRPVQAISSPDGYGQGPLALQLARAGGLERVVLLPNGVVLFPDRPATSEQFAREVTGREVPLARVLVGALERSAHGLLVEHAELLARGPSDSQQIRYALPYLPEQRRLVLMGHHLERLFGLDDLVSAGGVRLWTARDLALGAADISALFAAAGRPLREEEADAIRRLSEGWYHAVSLLLYIWQRGGNVALAQALSEGLTGSPHDGPGLVLVGETLQHLPAHLRDAAMLVSIPETLDPVMVGAVTGENGVRILEELTDSDLFLSPVGGVLRFNPVFRDLMRRIARQRLPGEVLRRAERMCGHLLIERGDLIAALPHLAEAEDWDAYRALLTERIALPIMDETLAARRTIDRLPRAFVHSDPVIVVMRYQIACWTGEPGTTEELREFVRSLPERSIAEIEECFWLNSDLDRAKAVIDAIREDFEGRGWGYFTHVADAQVLMREGRVSDAHAAIQAAIVRTEELPEDPTGRFNRFQYRQARTLGAAIAIETGDPERALAYLEGARARRDRQDQIADWGDVLTQAAHGLRGEAIDLIQVDAAVHRQIARGQSQKAAAQLELAYGVAVLAGASELARSYIELLASFAPRLGAPAERLRAQTLIALDAVARGDREAARRALPLRVHVRGCESVNRRADLAHALIDGTGDLASLAQAWAAAGAPLEAALCDLAEADIASDERVRQEAVRRARARLVTTKAKTSWLPLPIGIAPMLRSLGDVEDPVIEGVLRMHPAETIAAIHAAFEGLDPLGLRALILLAHLEGSSTALQRIASGHGPHRRVAVRALDLLADAVPATLPPRLRQVLDLLYEGASNKRIGLVLGISERTAANHVARLCAHFGVQSRGEAVAAGLRLDGKV